MATAAEMVILLKAALEKNVGLASITVDGLGVTYNRQQAMDELAAWEKQAAANAGRNPVQSIRLGGAW